MEQGPEIACEVGASSATVPNERTKIRTRKKDKELSINDKVNVETMSILTLL